MSAASSRRTNSDPACQPPSHLSLLHLPPHQPKMSTLSQIHTFLKLYFGDALSHVLDMLYGVRDSKSDVENASVGVRDSIADIASSASQSEDPIALDTDPAALLPPPIDPVEGDPFSAVVVVNLPLPSLPSILTKPPARPPLAAQDVSPQNFGYPSNEYHDRRLPLGTVTNIPRVDKVKTLKAKPVRPAVVNWSHPTGAPRGRRSRARRSLPVSVDITSAADAYLSTAIVLSALESDFVSGPETHYAPSPGPGSPEWNDTKAALLAQVRSWSEQVKASRRHSLPIPVRVPVPARSKASKRHSAPPVLAASSKSPRLDLEDLLSSLIVDAQDTIAALDAENCYSATGLGLGFVATKSCEEIGSTHGVVGGSKYEDDAVRIRELGIHTFSADALNSGTTFVIDACDDHGKEHNPGWDSASGLISSISASRSMAALTNASSRSLSDLLAAFDDVLAGPHWRRILSRADGIARRNDSVV
ncbi:hypothetical protein DFH09DRAFT_1397075 [Mycena vulgaris]|nr:hypothetical protein DFH09DRAFT_1397075 [Mycena vulgaris]